jgi:hypothetical protein
MIDFIPGDKSYTFKGCGIPGSYGIGTRNSYYRHRRGLAIVSLVGHYLRQRSVVLMVMIEFNFIPYIQTYQDDDGHPKRKPRDIDKRRRSVFQQISERDPEIVLKHSNLFIASCRQQQQCQIANI